MRPSDGRPLTALMIAYQGGDLSAFDGLYAGLAPVLRRYLLSRTRDAAWTDDLLQETFLQIHRSRRTYNAAYPVEPWSIAIARHVFLMSRRGRVRKHDFDAGPVEELEHASIRGHETAILARDRVSRGLAELTPGTRRAVWLHHVWGWSFEEVGAKLGIREAAAKLRASRGMAVLRRALTEKRRDDGD
ncbi:MAG TPA: RNA polymerase sigma factor [Vicinamibacterales bacterium]